MPRNQSEKDPAKKPLLAWAQAAQAALDYNGPSHELRKLTDARDALELALPAEAWNQHFEGRGFIRQILESIYTTYGQPDGR